MTEAPDLSVLKRDARKTAAKPSETGEIKTTMAAGTGREVPLPRRRWSTRVLIPGGVLLSALGVLAYAARGALRPAIPVQVAPAVMRTDVQSATSGSAIVQAPGWVEPDPFPISVTTLADGIVEEVLVLEGEPVEKGEAVARLVADDAQLALQRAEAELRERESQLQRARAVVTQAQDNWDNPIELERKLETSQAMLAEKGAELVRLPAEIEVAKARLAELDDAFARVREARAASAGAISEQELIRAQKQRDAQAAVLESTQAREAIIKAQIAQLEAEVKAAERDLELRIADRRALDEAKAALAAAEAAVGRARAVRAEAQLRLDRMEVRAPADGIVMARLVQPGSKLMLGADNPAGAQVLRMYDPDRQQVRVDVALGDAAKVHVGQAAEVVVNSLPDRTFEGEVTRVVHEADIAKNTLQFKVAIKEPSPEIKPEMLARVKFLAEVTTRPAAEASLFVPAESVREGDGSATVWLFDQTHEVAQVRSVTLGSARLDGWVEVREGLRPGDRVIVNAPPTLKAGSKVRATNG